MLSPDIFFQKIIYKLQTKTAYRNKIKGGLIVNHQDRKKEFLTIVFAPWGTSPLLLSWIVKAVPKSSNILGIVPSKMLSEDPEEALKLCLDACDDSLSLIKQKLDSSSYLNIRIVGLSIGTGLAVLSSTVLAKEGYKIDRLDLVSPGSSMASAFWSSSGTKHLKKKYQKSGYDLKSLEELWRPFRIIDRLEQIKSIPTKVTYSKADLVIRPAETKRLITKMIKLKFKIKVRNNHFFGHYLTLFWVWATWRLKYKMSEDI